MGLFDFITWGNKDLKAAEADFLEILKIIEVKESEYKTYLIQFSENFNKSYNTYKKTLERSERVNIRTTAARNSFSSTVNENLEVAVSNLAGFKREDIASYLGTSIGILSATLTYGLFSGHYDGSEDAGYCKVTEEKIENFISTIHKKVDKRISLFNISGRVLELSKAKSSRYNLSSSLAGSISSELASHH